MVKKAWARAYSDGLNGYMERTFALDAQARLSATELEDERQKMWEKKIAG